MKLYSTIVFLSVGLVLLSSCSLMKQVSLVPKAPGNATDYFCTWNIQGYVVSYNSSESTLKSFEPKVYIWNR